MVISDIDRVREEPFIIRATYLLRREYSRTHSGEETKLFADHFENDDIYLLLTDLDAFSTKQGWM